VNVCFWYRLRVVLDKGPLNVLLLLFLFDLSAAFCTSARKLCESTLAGHMLISLDMNMVTVWVSAQCKWVRASITVGKLTNLLTINTHRQAT